MSLLPFGQVAPISRRVWAYVIDALIAAVIPVLGIVTAIVLLLGPLRGAAPEQLLAVLGLVISPIVSLLMLAWAVIYTLMQTRGGSIGMRARGIRMAAAVDGGRVGFWRALLRNIVFGVTSSVVIGMFSPLFDGTGRFQGWHDKVAGSLMMDARVAPPEPEPEPVVEAPAPPLLPAPSFDRLPPAPMPGFAPAAPRDEIAQPTPDAAPAAAAAPPVAPAPVRPAAPVAERGGLIAFVPGVTSSRDAGAPAPAAAVPPSAAPAPSPAPAPPLPSAAAPAASERAAAASIPPAPASAPPAPASIPPVPASGSRHSDAGAELAEDDLEQTRLSVPGHRLVFTWDDGTRVTVSRRTVFGRNPAADSGAIVVSVRDETLSLSKTHFEAAAEASGGWLMDRHSTNGTVIVRDGVRIACPAGERVHVRLGDVIEIADRTVTVGGYV